jgi:hypothetical protein
MKTSKNGQYVVAVAIKNGMYISKDFGSNWVLIPDTIKHPWTSITADPFCISDSGQYIVASIGNTTAENDVSYGIYNLVLSNYTYSYTPIRISYNNTFDFTFTSTLYDCSGTYYLKNNNNDQKLATKVVDVSYTQTITFTGINTNSFGYGSSTVSVYKLNDNPDDDARYDIQISDPMVINATCFLEGTKILAMGGRNWVKYIPIEKLKPGMRVKTLSSGFVPIKYIGYSILYNPGLATRVRDQLFVCKKSMYPELREDLVLTGNHSILVDTITDEEREQITETLGDIYVTEKKYRLPAFNDKRAEPYDKRGNFRIWNLALENDNYYMNYGIYANGLLVETTSCRYIKELSGMTLR